MMRLQKYLAHAGIASRRAAEEMIKQGRVEVNGEIITDMGVTVSEQDRIWVDGKLVTTAQQDKIYILLNKPVGYVSSAKDQFGRPTVLDLVKDLRQRVYPVGRLDYDTSGLILLTNDGSFTYQMTHPKHEVSKTYEAFVKGIPSKEEMNSFKAGLKIEDYVTSPAGILLKSVQSGNALVHITIHEGRNRQVRKMCETIGHKVITLKRITIGSVSLGNLPEGKWRLLNSEELNSLCIGNQ